MAGTHQKLQIFTNAVIRSASQEVDETLKRLEERRQAAVREARSQAREEAAACLRQQVGLIRSQAGQQISRRMLEQKRQIFLRREEIAQEVFQAVEERIRAFTASADYYPHLERLLRQALDSFGPVPFVRVLLRLEDLEAGPALARAAAPVEVEIRPGPFTLGGLVVECPQLNRRADASFDTARADLSGHFAEMFGLSLAGDLS